MGLHNNTQYYTLDEELLSISKELGTLYGDGWQGVGGSESKACKGQKRAEGNHVAGNDVSLTLLVFSEMHDSMRQMNSNPTQI
jgi:hypothetical protein